jgi:hypothetical protein
MPEGRKSFEAEDWKTAARRQRPMVHGTIALAVEWIGFTTTDKNAGTVKLRLSRRIHCIGFGSLRMLASPQ